MAYFKRNPNGKWFVQFRFRDCTGATCRKQKGGFNRKRDAEAWMEKYIFEMQTGKKITVEMEKFNLNIAICNIGKCNVDVQIIEKSQSKNRGGIAYWHQLKKKKTILTQFNSDIRIMQV